MRNVGRVFIVAAMMILGAAVSNLYAQASFLEFLKSQNTGKPAADFTLKNLKGEDVNMTAYRDGKRAIIFFWATWCPHCREALEHLNKNFAEIEKKNIKVILVDVGEGAADVSEHFKRHNITMDVLLDTNNSLAEAYSIVGVPTFYFIDEKGIAQAVKHSLPKDYEILFGKSVK